MQATNRKLSENTYTDVITHTCSKCGKEFDSYGLARVCDGCRVISSHAPVCTPGTPLTFREVQIINSVSKGKLNKEVAWELKLTEGTVKVYLSRIYSKTSTTNRTELTNMWLTRPNKDYRYQ